MPNIFGLTATEAAYTYCEDWLDNLILYIQENFDFMNSYIEKKIKKIRVARLEGTYLAWLDFKGFDLSDDSIDEILYKKAKVWLDNGPQFGEDLNLGVKIGLLAQVVLDSETGNPLDKQLRPLFFRLRHLQDQRCRARRVARSRCSRCPSRSCRPASCWG